MFLTPEDLELLTGYKKPAKQIQRLKQQRIPFWVNAFGRPVVLADNLKPRPVEARLGAIR